MISTKSGLNLSLFYVPQLGCMFHAYTKIIVLPKCDVGRKQVSNGPHSSDKCGPPEERSKMTDG